MPEYQVHIDFFDSDPEWIDVEADDLDSAARKVWEEWHVTGWTDASLSEGERILCLNLDAKSYEEALWDSAKDEWDVGPG